MSSTLQNRCERIVSADWLITGHPDESPIPSGAMAVDGSTVIGVGSRDDIEARWVATHNNHFNSKILMPGRVNAHTHAAMHLMRGIADDLPLTTWLNDHIWPLEAKWVSEDYVKTGCELAIAEMIRSGTTCFNDMYFYPEVVATVAARAGIRATVGLILLDFPTVWAGDANEYIAKGLALHDEVRHQPLITTAFAPHAPYTVSDEPLSRVATLAEELENGIHIHVHETALEVSESMSRHGMRPLERLHQLGLLGPRMMAVHMTQLLDAEITSLAENSVKVIHCPESNLKLASGLCPLGKLLDAGVTVALGTDGAASNNDIDMFTETRTAALLAKGVSGDARTLPAAQALAMASWWGAQTLGLTNTGLLREDYQADFITVEIDTIESTPLYDPVSAMVYNTTGQNVQDVWVAGQPLMTERELVTIDETDLLARVKHFSEQMV